MRALTLYTISNFSTSSRVKIEYNRLTRIGLETDDMGAISTFSGNNDDALRSSESTIRFNSVCGATRPATKGICKIALTLSHTHVVMRLCSRDYYPPPPSPAA